MKMERIEEAHGEDISYPAGEEAAAGTLAAIQRAFAVVEFDLSGTILRANDQFTSLMGYDGDEVVGEHHRIFCDAEYVNSAAYRQFWERLGNGQYQRGEFKRLRKDGSEVWLQAIYNPVLDREGRAQSIVKVAMDVTGQRLDALSAQGKIAAISRSQAVIEFDLSGRIVEVNPVFLAMKGYSAEQARALCHKDLCDPVYAASAEYEIFWEKLVRGEFVAGVFRRVASGGREVWIRATYAPILDLNGHPRRIVQFAHDITDQRRESAEAEGKMRALDRAQAIIEFDLAGNILGANANFLALTGYTLDEIRGRPHRIFCDAGEAGAAAYSDFWDRLARGEFVSGEFKRLRKDGREVWIQATYNPIVDSSGRPFKVVKFAVDVTAEKVSAAEAAARVEALGRSLAVVEFDLDGKVVSANDNFLRVVGYSLREIVGQHHAMFCSPDYVRSQEYRDFWLRLNKGEFHSGRFHRVGKFDRDIHIQATYNPIFDLRGEPHRIVKYAFDVTEQVLMEKAITDRGADMHRIADGLSHAIEGITRASGTANALSRQTRANAEDGQATLGSAIGAIEQIQKSASDIAEIVAIISEISGQTNLLAFNAEIEAARAGEHGVGFSVVAGEVRKLAERSSSAAREISRLIQESGARVAEGTERSRAAREAFGHIVESVHRTSDAIEDIASSAGEQQSVSGEVIALIQQLMAATGAGR